MLNDDDTWKSVIFLVIYHYYILKIDSPAWKKV